eukprot:9746747-Heterocapsa_arctica.AAC.1
MRKRKEEQAQFDNVQPVKEVKTATDKRNISQSSGSIDRLLKFRAQDDNPDDDLIPNSIPTLGSAIPGFEYIPQPST